jgi:hypothetical protein
MTVHLILIVGTVSAGDGQLLTRPFDRRSVAFWLPR